MVRSGSLKGFGAYSHIAVGTGPAEGLVMLMGPCKESEEPGWRRVRVMIGSARCWRLACDGFQAVGIADDALATCAADAITRPTDDAVSVRRVDVCIDHWGYNWELVDLDRFSCRQRGRGYAQEGAVEETMIGDRWTYRAPGGCTYYVGRRGSASRFLRIYNKSAEAAATGKLVWLEPIWRQEGWDGKSTVWRAEIEHGGEWLRQHGFTRYLDLAGCERSLWRHYLSVVRHTTGGRTRLKRRRTSAIWQAIGKAVANGPDGLWQWCPRPVKIGTDVSKLMAQAAGCLGRVGDLLGSIPWRGSSKDDRRGELLALIAEALDVRDARAGPAGKPG